MQLHAFPPLSAQKDLTKEHEDSKNLRNLFQLKNLNLLYNSFWK